MISKPDNTDAYLKQNWINTLPDAEIDKKRAELSFVKTYRNILNYLIEEEISTYNKKLIIVRINYKIEFYF